MATFRVYRAGVVATTYDATLGFRVITSNNLKSFWQGCRLGQRHGVYVFALKRRGPGAAMPFYVGKASKTCFNGETFNDRNRRAYTAALLASEGTPEIHLVALEQRRGRINHPAIDNLETLLIWIARHRNPALINRRKIDTTPANLMELSGANKILGVLNSGGGRIGADPQSFRDVMGL